MNSSDASATSSDDKVMALRYAGKCRLRGKALPARERAVYERSRKTVRCLDCTASPSIAEGSPPTTTTEAPVPEPEAPTPRLEAPTAEPDAATLKLGEPTPESDELTRRDPLPVSADGAATPTPEPPALGAPALEVPPPEPPAALPSGAPVGEDTYTDGEAGGSARAEFVRRHNKREDKVRKAHPKIGGFLLAVTDDPQTTAAWSKGASGEEILGSQMNKAAGPLLRVLHDRRVPGSRANIDHIAVGPGGVWVIDAKKYQGRPALKVEGGILSRTVEKLMVGRRDCTKLVDGVLKQVEIVQAALEAAGEKAPVHGALCFVDADWPLFGGAITTRGVQAVWWNKLLTAIRRPGDFDADAVKRVWQVLAAALPGY